jgi:hypothetical protein
MIQYTVEKEENNEIHVSINTLENFHIFKLFKQGIQLNTIGSNIHNPIFNVIQNLAS